MPQKRGTTVIQLFLALLLLCGAASNARALDPSLRAGRVDPDYAPMLTTPGHFTAATQAPGGQWLVGGNFDFINGAARRNIARLDADGSVDARFVAEKRDGMEIRSIAVATDGRVAVCYGASRGITFGLGPDDGTEMTVFASDGRIENQYSSSAAISTLPQGTSITRVAARENVFYYVRAVVSGSYPSSSTFFTVQAVGLANTAASTPTFNGAIRKLVPLADGSVLVSGSFSWTTPAGGNQRPHVARLKPDLSLDEWVPIGLPSGTVFWAIPGPNDATYVAVLTETIDGGQIQILRLAADGTVDPDFSAIQLPPYVGRYNNPFSQLSALPDGSLIVTFWKEVSVTSSSGLLSSALLRYDATGVLNESWSRAASAAGTSGFLALATDGSALLAEAGEPIDLLGNTPRSSVRRLEPNGSLGARLAEAQGRGTFDVMAVRADGAVVVSRGLLSGPTLAPYTTINGLPWAKTAWLRDDGSLDANFGFETSGSTGGGSLVLFGTSLHFDGSDRLLVSGNFSRFNGLPRTGLARLNADRTTDKDFIPELSQDFSVLGLASGTDGRVAVGSAERYMFNTSGFTPIYTGGFASLLADGRAETVAEEIAGASLLALQPDGAVLFVGSYRRDGAALAGLARLTPDHRLDTAYAPQIADGGIRRILALPDGKAVVAGSFTTVNGVTRRTLARLNADGSLDSAFDPGAGPNGLVYDVAVQPDGKLIVVGAFTSFADVACGHVVRVNADGTLDTTFDPGDTDGIVRRVAVLSDGRIVIAGDFTTVDFQPRAGLARLLPGTGPLPLSRPVALRVVQLSATEAQLAWDDIRREIGYRIERSLAGSSDWSPIGSVDADVTQFTDSSGGLGSQYRVIAIGSDGESPPSPAAAPALPGVTRDFTATAISPHVIRLVWGDVSRATGYRLERSADGESEWIGIATLGAGRTTHDDTGLTPATNWNYRLVSFNFAGSSGPSVVARSKTWPEIFPAAQGNWSGLVTPAGPFSQEAAGAMRLNINRSGAFTGVLRIGTNRVAIQGKYTSDGIATGAIADLPNQFDGFAISLDPGTGEATGGLLLAGSERATVRLRQSRGWTKLDPCPYRGAYTVLLPSDASDSASPAGTGFGRALVDNEGLVRFTGALPSNAAFSTGEMISSDGEWPLFAPIYRRSGALLGWARFSADGRLTPADGPLRWSKPMRPFAAMHREAFSVATNISGARYEALRPIWNPIPLMQIVFGSSDLPILPPAVAVRLNEQNMITITTRSGIKMMLSTDTGLFDGSFVVPGGRETRYFRGAILQPDIRGGGFFRGQAKSGSVTFEQQYSGGVISTY